MTFNPETLKQETIRLMAAHISRILDENFIGGADITPALPTEGPWPVAIYRLSPLNDQIEEICQAANGGDCVPWLAETIQSVCESLFAPPASYAYTIPDSFWGTPLGQAILHAQLNHLGDELITISEAARLAFGQNTHANRMKIQRRIASGALTRYIDPDDPNPTHAARLSRAQVEKELKK